jgi:hypothetical protein
MHSMESKNLIPNPPREPDVREVAGKSQLSRWLVILSFLILAFVQVVIVLKTESWRTGDSEHYIILAKTILNGQPYGAGRGSDFEPDILRMPGYPALIAVTGYLFGLKDVNIIIIQSILCLASVYLTWRVTSSAFGAVAGYVFLGLAVIYLAPQAMATLIMSEVPALFFVSLIYYLLLKPTTWRLVLIGFLAAIATYMRPYIILLSPTIALACLIQQRRLSWRPVAVLFATALPLLPWAVRNHSVTGKFSPLPNYSSLQFYEATVECKASVAALMQYTMQGVMPEQFKTTGIADQMARINRELSVPTDSALLWYYSVPGPYRGVSRKLMADRLLLSAAISNVNEQPTSFVMSRLFYFMPRLWFTGVFPEGLPSAVKQGLYWEGVLMLALGVVGVLLFARRIDSYSSLVALSAVGAILYASFSLCWMCVQARFTIPFRLLLVMFAANSIAVLIDQCRRQQARGRPL